MPQFFWGEWRKWDGAKIPLNSNFRPRLSRYGSDQNQTVGLAQIRERENLVAVVCRIHLMVWHRTIWAKEEEAHSEGGWKGAHGGWRWRDKEGRWVLTKRDSCYFDYYAPSASIHHFVSGAWDKDPQITFWYSILTLELYKSF